MLSCTEISFVISFFDFEKFGVKPKFPFLTHTEYIKKNYVAQLLSTSKQCILVGNMMCVCCREKV